MAEVEHVFECSGIGVACGEVVIFQETLLYQGQQRRVVAQCMGNILLLRERRHCD